MSISGSPFRWTGAILAAAVLGFFGVGVQGVGMTGETAEEPRADVITIDTMKQFRPLERPAVVFLHTRHTEALAGQGMDCQACHPMVDDRMSLKFKRTADTGRQAVMDTYHLNCVACHVEQAAGDRKTGPVECGACHIQKPVPSNRAAMAFDLSLHYRHAKAQDNKCEQCHHEYDAKAKKLFYAKGKEGSCRYCHKQETEDNRMSLRLAAHTDCIACHRKTAAAMKATGPVECTGCHAPERQQSIKTVSNVPRLERNQPDVVYIGAMPLQTPEAAVRTADGRMNPVPFDHKRHETTHTSCVVCHHADLTACNTCHTPMGDKKGRFVTLEQAMHRLDSDQSCMGCHERKQADPGCAGCHDTMAPARKRDDASCKACHATPPDPPPSAMDPEQARRVAARLLADRVPVTGTYDPSDIPEKVVIKTLSDQYDGVDLPHRKIVQTLVENLKDNDIARYFHLDKGTVCQGCHHNSPVSKTPPRCAGCHSVEPSSASDLFKPGLMAAYHGQCMGCHQAMGMAKPDARDCTACHIKKKVW